MSNDDLRPAENSSDTSQNAQQAQPRPAPERRSLFSIPPPLKRVFDKFPLITYGENGLPLRAPAWREEHTLYVFATDRGAKSGRPSFNPACLKWQTFLKLSKVPFRTVSSTNHASPSGMLPFLLSARSSAELAISAEPIASNRLRKWVLSQTGSDSVQEPRNVRCEAYASLLDNSIRKAWLFQLYLTPANSDVVHRLYVESCSSNPFVQMAISYKLRQAASSELIKATAPSAISEVDIMREAEDAFNALSSLLGQDEWFLGEQKPTLFDATVFAYTHLILGETMGWKENGMAEQLKQMENLVKHRERILQMYF